MIKRKSNENNDKKDGNVNKNDTNKTIIENHGNSKFENLATNISSKNGMRRNHIIDANQNNENVYKITNTPRNVSMLKLNEDTKKEKMKSKFIIPVRKECSSSSFNRTEHSLEVLKDISKTDYENKNEKGVKSVHVDQNMTHDVSTTMIQKTKTKTLVSEVVKKSNDVNTNKTNKIDDEKRLTKKGKEKKSKEITNDSGRKKEGTKKVEKVDSKGKRIVEEVEETKEDLNDDNDGDNGVSNGHGNDNNNDVDKDNDDINVDNNNDRNKNNDNNGDKIEKENQIKNARKNINNNKSDDINSNNGSVNMTEEKGNKGGMKSTKNRTNSNPSKNMGAIKDNDKNANKMKGKTKNDTANEDERKVSDKVDTAIVMQQSPTIPRKNKTAAAAAVEVEEDSMTTEAMKNVPRKALLSSELPKECSSEEDVLSDDDSLSLGSENENDEMEEEEEKREEYEIEVMNEGRSKKKGDNDRGNVDEQKHLTPNHHQDTDNNKNNNDDDKEDDGNSDEDDDMFFAE